MLSIYIVITTIKVIILFSYDMKQTDNSDEDIDMNEDEDDYDDDDDDQEHDTRYELSDDGDEDYVGINPAVVKYGKTTTRFKYIEDILYFHTPSSTIPRNTSAIRSAVNPTSPLQWNFKQHFLCLGDRDGFYFKCGFWDDATSQFIDHKFKIAWYNVAKIGSCVSRNSRPCIYVKFCVHPTIQKLLDNENNTGINGRQRSKRQWKNVPLSDCNASVKEFIKYPKLMFQLNTFQYSAQKIHKSIMQHAPIQNFQREFNFSGKFAPNGEVSCEYDEQEATLCNQMYRSRVEPCLQSHNKLFDTTFAQLGWMFSGNKGRVCVVCQKQIHYFEEHPVCLAPHHSMDSCDSNIIKRIYQNKYENQSTSWRTELCMYFAWYFFFLLPLFCFIS